MTLPASVYVTGTDTGIGKTVASTALVHALRAGGRRVVGMKPVASGCELSGGVWKNEDAVALQAASDPVPLYEDLNPYALPLPLAPEIAAREAGVSIDLQALVSAYARLQASAEVVVVEGVGGWAAPLAADLDQSDLVQALRLPVVMVVGMRLGCVSHARLTEAAIRAAGCRLVGWIANHVDPAMERQDENFRILCTRLHAPCWGRLPFSPGTDARELARRLEARQ